MLDTWRFRIFLASLLVAPPGCAFHLHVAERHEHYHGPGSRTVRDEAVENRHTGSSFDVVESMIDRLREDGERNDE